MRNNKIWITSDTHFFHKRIIEYENRPYINEEVMTQQLVKNWNKVVGKNDLVYHLGDVYLKAGREKIKEVLDSLNGNIILICGNHDESNFNFFRKSGRFLEVLKYGQKLMTYDNVILSHEPLELENSPFINIYGHVHGSSNYETITKNSACVCVERWNYTPVDYLKLLEQIKNENK